MNVPVESTSAQVRALLDSYRRTHYRVTLPDGEELTVRVGALAPSRLVGWLGDHRFAVFLSACNPRSQLLPTTLNDKRTEQLRRCLDRSRLSCLQGCGCLPPAWSEPGMLIAGLPMDRVDALAMRYEQNAILCVTSNTPTRLRLYRADWRDVIGEADDIEWPPFALTSV